MTAPGYGGCGFKGIGGPPSVLAQFVFDVRAGRPRAAVVLRCRASMRCCGHGAARLARSGINHCK